MSGHSKWSTIKRQKEATDAKKGAVFTKLANALTIAAKNGADPGMNFALRLVMDQARAANMPNANIQRAIDRGAGKLGGAQIEEVTYEGYGPGGIAVIVECATDNKNRTYPDVRVAFTKNGGSMAEPGSVAFQFSRKGEIRAAFTGDADEAMLTAIDAGAEDAEVEDGELLIYTDPKQLAAVRDALQAAGLTLKEAALTFVPNNTVDITDSETARKIMNLMDALDSLDDVTNTYS
ncbi:MAG TPA: YebC/PmpR family DNA-binding transcriptional regulator, partial [Candidatus Saccharimonadales bacterium]|nr:YebC/PmpR family DNA-binding transcriptional regulator [Candidatus Saccharimonadales bacterium]